MARHKKPSRHGRSGDPRKRAAEEQARRDAETTPELEDAVGEALELGHPIDIVMLASSLLASLEVGPSGRSSDGLPEGELPPAEEIVRMFVDSDDPDMIVFAWVIAQLVGDAGLITEADAALDRDWLPDWLAPLADAQVVSAWQTTDQLRDSTDIVLSLRIGDADLSLIGLIDFNSQGAMKDAFGVPVPLADVQAALSAQGRTGMDDRDLSLDDARAWLTEAVAAGARVEPPFETDTWPQLRPLLAWALAKLPTGGSGWQRRVWTSVDVADVVDQFAGSPTGDLVADPADRAVLVDALIALGRQSYGDPQLISAVNLEMGLEWIWPTALHYDLDQLLTLPDLLGPYVRWAHAQRGIPTGDTDEALAAIAHRRAVFVRDVAELLGEGGTG